MDNSWMYSEVTLMGTSPSPVDCMHWCNLWFVFSADTLAQCDRDAIFLSFQMKIMSCDTSDIQRGLARD